MSDQDPCYPLGLHLRYASERHWVFILDMPVGWLCQALVYVVIDTRDMYHWTLNHKQHAQVVGPKPALVRELAVEKSSQAHASHASGRKRQSSEEVFLPAGLKCFVT